MLSLRQTLDAARSLAAPVGTALAALVLLHAAGVTGAADGALRASYYTLRGGRRSGYGVLTVAEDPVTGDPGAARATTLAAVLSDLPRGVLVLGGPAPTAHTESAGGRPAPVAFAPAGGWPLLDTRGAEPVESVWLRAPGAGRPTAVAELLSAGGRVPGGDALAVNYLGRGEQPPRVDAARVAAGELPRGTFRGRYVVLGPDAGAGGVSTPVGAMGATAVVASALLAATDGVAWRTVPAVVRWVALALLCAACFAALRGRRRGVALGVAVAAVATLLALDFGLFASGTVLLGASAPVVAVIGALLAAWASDERAEWRALRRAGRDLPRPASPAEGGDVLWHRLASLAEAYLDCSSSVLAELPAGQWHLRLRALAGAAPEQVREKRRDIRREPFHSVFLSRRRAAVDGFMAAALGVRSVLVPLAAGETVYGLWILNYPAEGADAALRSPLVGALAAEMVRVLEKLRRDGGGGGVVAGPEQAGGEHEARSVEELAQSLARRAGAVARERRRERGLLEGMPVALLTATLWGEIEFSNAAMAQSLVREGLAEGAAGTLEELVAVLTGLGPPAVRALLRKAVTDGSAVRLPRAASAGDATDYLLSWVRADAAAEPLGRFALAALPRSAGAASVPGSAGDARAAVLLALRRMRALTHGRGRPVHLEMADPLPSVAGDGGVLGDAVLALLVDADRYGDARAPVRVRVGAEDGGVLVVVSDPSHAVPQAALDGLFESESSIQRGSRPSMSGGLTHAWIRLRTEGGDLRVDSNPGRGTEFRVRMPARA